MSEIQRGIYYIEEIAEGSYKIYERRDASMYLVCGREKACLIDTAYGLCDLGGLIRGLTDLPVTVVNTHSHIDHVMGNHWFYGGGSGEMYLNSADWPLYEEMASEFAEIVSQPWVREEYGEYIGDMDPAAVRFPKPIDIREGEKIDLGGKTLEAVEMPGHTAGSIILLDRDAKICYSGDSIIEHLWIFLEESLPPEVYLESLRHAREVLAEAGVERIYDGHFSYVPLTLPKTDIMLAGMESVIAGTASGEHFQNHAGTGTEYDFGGWSVLC